MREDTIRSTVWENFLKIRNEFPKKVVIKTFKEEITYEELLQKAEVFARYLYDLRPQCIALLFNQGVNMVVVMLAALKNNCTYVPIDSTLPKERIEHIIKDSGASVLIADRQNIDRALLLESNVSVVEYSTSAFSALKIRKGYNLTRNLYFDLAYILYTSGSTGNPKGVPQSQSNMYSHIKNYCYSLEISSSDNISLFSSYAFDASVMDIFSAILTGATLFPFDIKQHDILSILNSIKDNKLTILHMVPSLFRSISYLLRRDALSTSTVRYVVLGGEEVKNSDVMLFNENFFSGSILVNGYGPTECTVALQHFIKHGSNFMGSRISLGGTLPGIECFLRHINPDGVGEIVLKSQFVSKKYWNHPEISKIKFVHCSKSGISTYYTGDLGRFNKDGEVEYIGRKDNQVKVRGFRIEPEEVEKAILEYPNIRESVVVTKSLSDKIENKNLVAFYISDKKLEQEKIKVFLGKKLPEYMIPHMLIHLNETPKSINGKVDRKALQNLCISSKKLISSSNSKIEMKIKSIWSKILGISVIQIRADDTFFELGGDSITAILLVAEMRQSFGIETSIQDIFICNTIPKLYHLVTSERKKSSLSRAELSDSSIGEDDCNLNRSDFTDKAIYDSYINAKPSNVSNIYQANSLQQGFIYNTLSNPEGDDTYVVQVLWQYKQPIDIKLLKTAWEDAQKKFESLRLGFNWDDDLVQCVYSDVSLDWYFFDYSDESPESRKLEILRIQKNDRLERYKLKKGGLFRVYLIKEDSSKYTCIFSYHHAALDGWSCKILFQYVHGLYLTCKSGLSYNFNLTDVYGNVQRYIQKHKNKGLLATFYPVHE